MAKNKKEQEDKDLKELEDSLDDLLKDGLATKEEVDKVKDSIKKLNPKNLSKKERILRFLKKYLIAFVLYMVICSACFGFFSSSITFVNKLFPFIGFAIFAVFELFMRNNPLANLIKKKVGFITFYTIYTAIMIIILYFLAPYLYFMEFNSPFILCGFYFAFEALYLIFNYVMIRRRFIY